MQKSSAFICLAFCLPALAAADEPVDYAKHIKPLLKSRCFACHGALKQKAGLRLDAGMLIHKGSESGAVIEPGKSGESLLIDAVTGANGAAHMPPADEGAPLTPEEVAKLRAWIDAGAVYPESDPPETDPRAHWAFQVPVRPAVPAVAADWSANPLDAFIAAEHQQRGLVAAPLADKGTLLRRVTLDLTGLPPTREELHAFLADGSPDAYEKVVERLLDSPQHGERWGRHWMDVWRYSDWYGRRMENDVRNSDPQIWRWRDWIVQSLNADKGYDRMVQEMLAADEIAPGDDELVVATGFLVRNWYSLNYNQWMRDQVEHTGKAFLGLTFNCAHCHDHKYDPITHEEYFRFRAFFEPLELRRDRVANEPDPGPFKKYIYASSTAPLKSGLIRVFDEKLDAQTFVYRLGDEREIVKDKPPVEPGAPAFLGGEQLAIEPVVLPPVAWYPGLKPFIAAEDLVKLSAAQKAAADALVSAQQANAAADQLRILETKLAAAAAQLASLQARIAADSAKYGSTGTSADELSKAASRAERDATVRTAESTLAQEDAALAAAKAKADGLPDGEEKTKAVAAATAAQQKRDAAAKALEQAQQAAQGDASAYTPLSPVYPDKSTGRRTALAKWITNRQNPLTARVAVNHIWLRHFGRPLVESVFDFGRNGKPPSHPQLLDWLAVEFMERGWSMKHIHRLIVTSRDYRLDSRVGETQRASLERDPENRSLWRFAPRRLEAEAVRDCVLAASGQLDRTIGGMQLENGQEEASTRRSLYFSSYPEAGGQLPFVSMFDAPNPCDCYRRAETVMPQQALALTNSRLLLNQSRILARRLSESVSASGDPAAQQEAFLVAAFEQLLSRPPRAEEVVTCREFLSRQQELYAQAVDGLAAKGSEGLVAPAGEPVQRARESLVRALINHHEFVTLR